MTATIGLFRALTIPALRLCRTFAIFTLRLLRALSVSAGRLFGFLTSPIRLLRSFQLPSFGLFRLLPFRAFTLLLDLTPTTLSRRRLFAPPGLIRGHLPSRGALPLAGG
ncbi:MAG TPA: hypothetical protein VFX46_02565, partial [Hyphomicrobiaceae bacterium]|nr:hypothetical protein [Hyphomicrobiaceae bacterium]